MEQQIYDNGGFTSGMYCKVITAELSSTETVISPLEAKTVMGGISQGDETWLIGNHNSAPRMYGVLFSIDGEKHIITP